MAKIEFKNVSLSYGEGKGARQILDNINLTIGSGEFVSIIGPSGCGKTTLLRLMGGLVRPSAGTILFEGTEIRGPSRQRAVVFQDYGRALLPWRPVWANVALALEDGKLTRAQQKASSIELLRSMKLEHVIEQYPGQLSGGMQQRVQIARSLAQDPRILLMDEPFGALDAMTRQQLQDEISRIVRERNITAVFITHDLEEAIYLGDRVIALAAHPGRVLEEINVGLSRPRDQLRTREHSEFLQHRHKLFVLLQQH
jgi:NitT/TauT family transport system ATP-binding protein